MANNPDATIGSNLTSLGKLTAKYTEMGPNYNPSKESIKLISLTTLLENATATHKDVGDARLAYQLITAERAASFMPLDKLVTRCLNTFLTTDALDTVKDNSKTLAKKIRGIATNKPPKKKVESDQETADKNHSTIQQSYGMITENFGLFIEMLRSEPTYLPNKDDIKPAALDALLATMIAKNASVELPYVRWKTALSSRDNLFFAEKTGLVDRALDSKKYVLGDFGSNSPEYNAVKGIKFTRKR